jgi:hypothetical protein
VKVDVAYAAGKPVLTGTWHLAVRSEQFATVLEKLGLPEVALSGDGSFSYNIESGAASAAGAIEGTAAKFEKLGPDLAAIGALKLHAAFDGGSSKDAAQLNKLDFDVATTDANSSRSRRSRSCRLPSRIKRSRPNGPAQSWRV